MAGNQSKTKYGIEVIGELDGFKYHLFVTKTDRKSYELSPHMQNGCMIYDSFEEAKAAINYHLDQFESPFEDAFDKHDKTEYKILRTAAAVVRIKQSISWDETSA